ncbi:MAG: autotransporter domain-containing protein [Alphaproteobacteria bacterium]|nr:autotransporter domain-containing protein [Alphaproteobacteria bacterium]
MGRHGRRPSARLRLALLAHASSFVLVIAACDQNAWAKPPTTTGNGQPGGIGHNPNDLKDGVIDGNAGGPHSASQESSCDGGTNVVGLLNMTDATPMPLTGSIECVTVTTTVAHDVVSEATIGDPGTGYSSFLVGGEGVITGELWNKGTITGGYADLTGSGLGALTILGDVQGGVLNSGLISSPGNNAIQLGTSSDSILLPGTIEGGITNNGTIIGLNDGLATIAGSLSGGFVNNENALITAGNAGVFIADTFDTWSGGISNAGTVHGDGVGIFIGAPGATNVEFSGGIFNDTTGVISGASGPAIFVSGGSYSGGLTNWGLITETGESFTDVYGGAGVILDAQTVDGNIENHGAIDGVYRQGLLITDNVTQFNGSITNAGVIDGAAGGVVVIAQSVRGDFSNTGTILGGAGTGVAYFNNSIEGAGGEGTTATFTNSGTILGAAGVVIDGQTVFANFINGDAGTGVGEIVGSTSAGVILVAQNWTGDVTNNGSISGATVGMALGYDPFLGKASPGDEFLGNVVNNGSIHGGTAGLIIAADNYTGDFTNNGSVTGGQYGVALEGGGMFAGSYLALDCIDCVQPFSLGGGTFTGDVTNNDFMGGDTALFVSYDNFIGNLTNSGTGTLQGTNYGLLLDVDDFQGNLSNDGTILAGGEGGYGAALQVGAGSTEGGTVLSSQAFSGDITNSGLIHGQNTGLAVVLDAYTADATGLTNSGTITGDNWSGVYIRTNQWTGDVVNESGGQIVGGVTGVYIGAGSIDGNFTNNGYIEGGVTGVFINAGTINGDFSNNGSIVGNSFDTGWNISALSYTGNIANGTGGLITAPSNALHLRIDTFSGEITNDGVIAAPSGNAVVIEGYYSNGFYDGAFTNTGTIDASNIGINLTGAELTGGITNDGGTITGATAISTYDATGATTITNTGGGLIVGDLRLANNFADTYVAEDGGFIGQIIGSAGGEGGNDDSVIVQNGTQYFIGKASNLASFTVDNGGAAIMGATFEGDANGGGYSFANVDAINVNNGGTLYIDKTASLTAGSYTQQAGGTLEFYLGAPGGANFSNLTGTQSAAAGTDYGQIHVTGTATLDGAVAAFLDPTFASANSSLDAVVYNDVLIADGGISGDFNTLALISNSNLFELNEVLDGNTVDLTVTRTSLGQVGNIGDIVVETGGPWKSMVNDRSNGIGSGSCSLAGSGWCLNAYAANDAGGTGVMSDATPGADAFDWLRTGVRRPGETAVWGRAVGVWGDTGGDVNHAATDFNTYGAIFGIDHVFTQVFMAGAAAQWTKSNIDFSGSPDNAHIDSLEVGGYMSYGDARFYVNANTSVIFHSIDVTRYSPGGSARGSYDGMTVSGYAEAGRIFETYEGLRIQPLAALSFAHLDTDAYNETGSATTLLHVFDASLDSMKSMLGARLAYPIATDSGRKWVPETRVIWSHELMDDHSAFDANPLSNPSNISTVTGQTYNRNSIILGAGLTAPLSSATTLYLDYDAALNEDITTQTVSGGLRTRW